MRLPRTLGLIATTIVTVLVTDLIFQSSLLRILWPTITEPADGALVTPPVTVRWDGPPRLLATLVGSGLREELGLRDNPFELPTERFPRTGQFGVQLRSPSFGWLTQTERRFLVRLAPPEEPAAEAPTPPPDQTKDDAPAVIARLQEEIDSARAQNEALRDEARTLREQTRELAAAVRDLQVAQLDADADHAALAEQQTELLDQQETLTQENRELRERLASIPPCTVWGYLFYPRPQTVPAIRRFVVVSDGRGRVFQTLLDCEATRRRDRSAASACVCVGPTVDH